MANIKTLAPTLFDALKAVELGCRKIQDDPHFQPNMSRWLILLPDGICAGCLATCTLLHLANKTGKDIFDLHSASTVTNLTEIKDRAFAFEIEEGPRQNYYSEFSVFEAAIDCLRHCELYPLLEFYGLSKHRNTRTAEMWLMENQPRSVAYGNTKKELLQYADFLNLKLIPKMQELFLKPQSV
jgi:hypothetical protein